MSILLGDDGQADVGIPAVPAVVAAEIAGNTLREWLGVTLEEQFNWASPRDAFNAWRTAFELHGILVMQLRLGKEGLRGFSFPDERAPLVAVNSAENLQARIFTLLHELAHLASSTTASCLEGVSAVGPGDSIERWCDSVASSAILPTEALLVAFDELAGVESDFERIRSLASRFKVSLRATTVALIRTGRASAETYADVEEKAPTSDYDKGFGRGQPQHAPQQRLGEVGPLAASVVLRALSNERATEREAREYLRLDGSELSDLGAAIRASA